MIASIFHAGSGIGNQLHRYVATRCIAKDRGYEFGMFYPENFKGKHFMNLDMGVHVSEDTRYWVNEHAFIEKKVTENGIDIRGYDPEVNFIKNFTIIDGEFQDPLYFEHHLDKIREWLKVEPLDMPDDVCVINFRGGEYTLYPDLFLPKEYWDMAISKMRKINPNMKFEVHTDDPVTAHQFFPEFLVTANLELNWRSIRYAKHLILSNSSFAILPALLGDAREIIAPRYWSRYNLKTWAMPQNFYSRFNHIHHEID